MFSCFRDRIQIHDKTNIVLITLMFTISLLLHQVYFAQNNYIF